MPRQDRIRPRAPQRPAADQPVWRSTPPTADSLRDIDTLVFDLQDAGRALYPFPPWPKPCGPQPNRACGSWCWIVPTRAGRSHQRPRSGCRQGFVHRLPRLARSARHDGGRTGPLVSARPTETGSDRAARRGAHARLPSLALVQPDWVGLGSPRPVAHAFDRLAHPGVAWVEGANVSVGRGTDHPLNGWGPWLKPLAWSKPLNAWVQTAPWPAFSSRPLSSPRRPHHTRANCARSPGARTRSQPARCPCWAPPWCASCTASGPNPSGGPNPGHDRISPHCKGLRDGQDLGSLALHLARRLRRLSTTPGQLAALPARVRPA